MPDLKWHKWTNKNLPAGDCNWVSDIDSIIRSRGGCVALVEIKRKGYKVPIWQRMTYGILDALLIDAEGKVLNSEYLPYPVTVSSYKGIYEIIFENTWFDDGKVFYTINGSDRIETSEDELINILSFDKCELCYPSHCACHNSCDN